MYLNTLQPGPGSKQSPKRLGRGIGSGLGKTCGRGHKGQRARAGGFHKVGFEGGQMPLQRRLAKFGFKSKKALVFKEIRLDVLNKISSDVIDLKALHEHGIINSRIKSVKIIGTGKVDKAVRIAGLKVTRGARAAIEGVGGKIEA